VARGYNSVLAKKVEIIYNYFLECIMVQAQMMTLYENLQLGVKSIRCKKEGKFEKAILL